MGSSSFRELIQQGEADSRASLVYIRPSVHRLTRRSGGSKEKAKLRTLAAD